jgi:hypothetical protein
LSVAEITTGQTHDLLTSTRKFLAGATRDQAGRGDIPAEAWAAVDATFATLLEGCEGR